MSNFDTFEEEEFQGSWNGRTLVRIFKLLRPHWRATLTFVIAVGTVAFIEAFETRLVSLAIDEGVQSGNPARLTDILMLYGLSVLGLASGVFVFIYACGRLGQQVQYDLRKAIFEHLQKLSLAYYSKTPVGWIMSRVVSDSERIADLISWGLLDVTWGIMNISTALIFMLTINARLTLVVVPLVPVLLAIATWFQSRILVGFRESRRANSKITGNYAEMITGVRVIKALNREESSIEEFGLLTRQMYHASFSAAWWSALFLPSVMVASATAVGAVVYFGGRSVETLTVGGMSIGEIQAFVAYITFMMWPVVEAARVFASMQHAIASAERSFSLLDAKPDIVNRPNAVAVDTLKGDIEFDDVTFAYDDGKAILENFSLTIKAGETVALVGETGGGKSTIVNLIGRFYEPTKGFIRINGMDYTQMTLESIHSRLGVVLQTPHLFSGTIRENIRYGRLDATDEEIEAAAKIAGADEFITALEKGYEAEVGEGGNSLSTGQKQLISIARAALSNPHIFIMDEATSSVDTLTEAQIQKGMNALMEGRTSFIIAHRLSTIRTADRIVVIEGGKITEMGNHAELIKQRGHYYGLYTKQFRNEREQHYTQSETGALALSATPLSAGD